MRKESMVNGRRRNGAARVFLLAILGSVTISGVAAQTAEEIIRRMEENQVHETAYIEGRMVVDDRFGERSSTFISWSRGEEEMLVEFTSAAERGQKVLRTDDSIYLYYPDAARVIRMQGSALRESMLGSDISYEDMTGNRGLLEDYRVERKSDAQVEGHPCYVVELNATSRDVAYPKQIIWVDKELFVMRKAEQYALSGRLLKTAKVQELMEVKGKIFPSVMRIEDQLKRNSKTRFVIEEADIGVELPRDIFSLEQLRF